MADSKTIDQGRAVSLRIPETRTAKSPQPVKERYVTGQSDGQFLADLLNQQIIEKHEWRAKELQQELEKAFVAMNDLTERAPRTNFEADWSREIRDDLGVINAFLRSSKVYPQVSLPKSHRKHPVLIVEYTSDTAGMTRRNAISCCCSLIRLGLSDRIRRCLRCDVWFFSKKSDGKYCSRNCQTKTTEESRRYKREYARRSYWSDQEQERRSKLRAAKGR
jgi:hypothetical protein